MTDIHVGDVSEYQPNVDAPNYLKAHRSIIVRVHNGTRPDRMMPARMNYLRRHPFTAIGWYQYLVPSRDSATQAREFIQVVRSLRVNEFPIVDIEEGSGDQTTRASTWFSIVDRWANFRATLYSGESYLQTNLGGAGHWSGRPIWVAAYRSREPTVPHILWQYSDRIAYPGIAGRIDSSVHHGTDQEFIYGVRHAAGGGGVP